MKTKRVTATKVAQKEYYDPETDTSSTVPPYFDDIGADMMETLNLIEYSLTSLTEMDSGYQMMCK